MRAAYLGLLLLVATTGCTRRATQLVVVVTTDVPEASCVDAVLTVLDGPAEGRRSVRRFDLATLGRSFSFGVAQPQEGGARVEIDVTALDECADSARRLVSRRARTGFLPEQSLRLPIHLLSRCQSVVCADTETCGDAGTCIPTEVTPETLGQVAPGREIDDAGPPPDVRSPDAAVPVTVVMRDDFEGGLLGELAMPHGTDAESGSRSTYEITTDPDRGLVFHLARAGSANSGGSRSLRYPSDTPVPAGARIWVRFAYRVESDTLAGLGNGTPCAEMPAAIALRTRAADGTAGDAYVGGDLLHPTGTLCTVSPFVSVTRGLAGWNQVVLDATPYVNASHGGAPATSLERISVFAAGWDWSTYFDDVEVTLE